MTTATHYWFAAMVMQSVDIYSAGSADEGSKPLRRLPTPGWMCSHQTAHMIKNNSRRIAENRSILPMRDATVIALTMRNGRSRPESLIYESQTRR